MSGGTSSLTMVCVAVSDARIGNGFRTGFVLAQRQQSAVLYVPSLLTSVTVPSCTSAPSTRRPCSSCRRSS